MLKRNIIKVSIYLLSIIVLQLCIYNFFSNLTKNEQILENIELALNQKQSAIYFGDSSVFFGSPENVAVDKIVNELMPDLRIYPAYQAAYHLGVYNAYIHRIINGADQKPLLIIPINMRSFSMAWSDNRGWQFNKTIVYLQYQDTALHVFHGFLQAIGALDLAYMFYDSTLSDPKKMKTHEGKFHNYPKYQYLYKLEDNHKRLRNLETLLETAKNNNLQIFFYFTPLIHEDIERSDFKNALQRLEDNKRLVKNLINSYGYNIHDFTYLLTKDKMLAFEHMTAAGKSELAHAIAAELQATHLESKLNLNHYNQHIF